MEIPEIKDVFPFEYIGGGYFRRKGVPKGESAEILHGDQAIRYLYEKLTEKEDQHGSGKAQG